jgi:hypothetical protein
MNGVGIGDAAQIHGVIPAQAGTSVFLSASLTGVPACAGMTR